MEEYASLILLAFLALVILIVGLHLRKTFQKKDAEEFTAKLKAKKRATRREELAQSIKLISWNDAFCIDEGLIDDDHKFLFDLVNKFKSNIPKFQTTEQMVPLLKLLLKYTQTHFQRETRLQNAARYHDLKAHHEAHKNLITKFNTLVNKAQEANEDTIIDSAVEIGDFLEEWLTKHVLEEDLAMRPYVKKMKEQAGKMQDIA